MIEAGVFGPNDRVELINGEIIEMGPQNLPHGAAVSKANMFLVRLCPDNCYLRVQSTLPLTGADAPEPDIVIVRGTPDDHSTRRPEEVLLAVEVADTSLAFDRTEKMQLYARHEIPEYWIVNLPERVIEVYRNPSGGEYRSKQTFPKGEDFSPLFDQEASVTADNFLPSPT